MIPTCNGFKACWLKYKMLLSPTFGFDTLNFTKDKFTGHARVTKSILQQKNFQDKSFFSREITLRKFLEVFRRRKLRLTKIPFNAALVTASVYLRFHSLVF